MILPMGLKDITTATSYWFVGLLKLTIKLTPKGFPKPMVMIPIKMCLLPQHDQCGILSISMVSSRYVTLVSHGPLTALFTHS